MKIGIGIDTGGTYTDAAIYDFDSGEILGTAKSLTTKQDLSIGILGAIDGLPAHLAKQAAMISLSTTLATNACVEDKGGRAKLLFFGGDAAVLDRFGAKYGLPPADEISIQDCETTFSGEILRQPDWAAFTREISQGYDVWDGVGIIETNAIRNGAEIEKKAKTLFQQYNQIPVVCAHELFAELNCLQRASSTLLNARLFPVIQEFLDAVKKALALRGICAELVIVRSDGSLMNEAFAAVRPVETLLCGPAASAMGGMYLADCKDCMIVDMGGTTTDLALVRDGLPVTVTDGISIGKWKTFVDGLYVKTFGLGGDSAIHYDGSRLVVEEYRVMPLCVAAKAYPRVLANLQQISIRRHTKFLYEHYLLVRDIAQSNRYTDDEKAFCAALTDGPLLVSQAAEAVGKDVYNLHIDRLLRDGVVQVCGLTPTDIMHLKGDFDTYCTEAARLGAAFVAYNLDTTVEKLCDRVYDEIKRKLYFHIVEALLEHANAGYMKNGINDDVAHLIDQAYQAAKSGVQDDVLSMPFQTKLALVGVGAPIHIFLQDVAAMLGTRAVCPKHHEVANALGAIVGSISAVCSVEIRPNYGPGGVTGYTVYGTEENRIFEELEQAVAFAEQQARARARKQAVSRGAKGALTVTVAVKGRDAAARGCNIYLGTTVVARAVGAVGF